MKNPLKIKRGNDGEVFEHTPGKFGVDWRNESGYLQSITDLSRRDLQRVADKINEFLITK